MTLEIPTSGQTITQLLRRARNNRDILSLLRAGYCILRQGRLRELLYGLYCEITTSPSAVHPLPAARHIARLPETERHRTELPEILGRQQLIEAFGESYAVADLPDNFEGCRAQAIALIGTNLVCGEYGENSARIAVLSRNKCHVFNPYQRTRGVRHIHLLCSAGLNNQLFVTTGDATKLLDRFTIVDGTPHHIFRHRKRLAGYTAAAAVGGRFYFGTDFSGRPNYIETLEGEQYFFPSRAYRKFVQSLTAVGRRYLVAVSADLSGDADNRTLSVFDVREKAFRLCCAWNQVFAPVSELNLAPAWGSGRPATQQIPT